MRVLHVVAETPLSFLQHLKDITYIERRPLRYVVLMSVARFQNATPINSVRQFLRGAPAVASAHPRGQPRRRILVPAEGRELRDARRDVRERHVIPFSLCTLRPLIGPQASSLSSSRTKPRLRPSRIRFSILRRSFRTVRAAPPPGSPLPAIAAWTPPSRSSRCSSGSARLSSPQGRSRRSTCTRRCCSSPRSSRRRTPCRSRATRSCRS